MMECKGFELDDNRCYSSCTETVAIAPTQLLPFFHQWLREGLHRWRRLIIAFHFNQATMSGRALGQLRCADISGQYIGIAM